MKGQLTLLRSYVLLNTFQTFHTYPVLFCNSVGFITSERNIAC